ncbi:transferrin-binding protein-like solute binding protein [Lonepinella sp. BR2357]|uniref:transferrin-binding protein-like solute binding protein n=1 Tax=Lonepinella sp. BR2357 TaxID=3434549 RepID=UPI003F6E1E48
MKNMKKFSLNLITVVLASTALAACSSSKGGDDPNTGKYLTSPPTTPAKPIDSSSSSGDEHSSDHDSTTEKQQSADQNTQGMELTRGETGVVDKTQKDDSKATDDDSKATDDDSKATDDDSKATDDDSKATGDDSKATDDDSKATGDDSKATDDDSKATKDDLKAKEEAEKADKPRVDKNVDEVKKSFSNNQTTYDDGDSSIKFNYVNGKLLKVGDNFESKAFATNNKNLNVLVLDGQKIELYSDDEIVKWRDQLHPDDTGTIGSGDNPTTSKDIKEGEKSIGKVGYLPSKRNSQDFEQTRFGYVVKDGITHLFVQGIRTPEDQKEARTPFNYSDLNSEYQSNQGQILYAINEDEDEKVESIYTYQGGAFYGKNGQYTELSAEGAVDFKDKKMVLELKDKDVTKLTLGANVKGLEFDGMVNGVQTNGAFYGSGGQDIAGVFYQTKGVDKDYNGVFGASRVCSGLTTCESLDKDSLTSTRETYQGYLEKTENEYMKKIYQQRIDQANEGLKKVEEVKSKLDNITIE